MSHTQLLKHAVINHKLYLGMQPMLVTQAFHQWNHLPGLGESMESEDNCLLSTGHGDFFVTGECDIFLLGGKPDLRSSVFSSWV